MTNHNNNYSVETLRYILPAYKLLFGCSHDDTQASKYNIVHTHGYMPYVLQSTIFPSKRAVFLVQYDRLISHKCLNMGK